MCSTALAPTCLEDAQVRKALVLREQVVQVRGASAWVAQDDERLRVELLAGDGPAKQQPVGKAGRLVSAAWSNLPEGTLVV